MGSNDGSSPWQGIDIRSYSLLICDAPNLGIRYHRLGAHYSSYTSTLHYYYYNNYILKVIQTQDLYYIGHI